MNVCWKCSHEVAGDAAVCGFCGESLGATGVGGREQDSLLDPPFDVVNETPYRLVERESIHDPIELADDPDDYGYATHAVASTEDHEGAHEDPAPRAEDATEVSRPQPAHAVDPKHADAAASRPFTPQEIGAVLVAAALGGVVVLWTLRSFAPPSTHAATAAPAPGKTVAASSSSRARRSWTRADAEWVDPKKGIALQVLSEDRVKVWQRQAQPILVVRCLAKRTDAFVFIESAAKIEPQPWRTVRVGFDDEAEHTERWPDSADHDALFSPDGAAFASRLTHARTLTFGYTPHNADPVVAQFQVTGLAEQLAPLAKHCGR
jgi:hypothetical protein